MPRVLLLLLVTCFDLWSQTPLFTVGYTTSDDGVQIVYDVRGDGPVAIVLVHGWSCDRTYWSGQVAPLAKKYKVVAIDLAGHGGSGLGRKDYTMESFGADVAAVVHKLELKNIILVGHSMGGDVIAEAAKRLLTDAKASAPSGPSESSVVISGLVMVDTYKKLGTGRSEQDVEKFVARFRDHFRDSAKVVVRSMFLPTSDPKLVEAVAADMSSAPPAVALSAMYHAFSYSRQMPSTLQELKLPTIFINPDDSPTDMVSMKKYGVEVVIVKGTGHFVMMEDVKEFNEVLAKALERSVSKQ